MWLLHQAVRCTFTAENQGEKIQPYAGEIRIDDFPQHNFYKVQRNIYWAGEKHWVGI